MKNAKDLNNCLDTLFGFESPVKAQNGLKGNYKINFEISEKAQNSLKRKNKIKIQNKRLEQCLELAMTQTSLGSEVTVSENLGKRGIQDLSNGLFFSSFFILTKMIS